MARPKSVEPRLVVPAEKRVVPVTIQLPAPHAKQYELINAFELNNARFVVGACGTKFGKTFGCSIRLVQEAWNNQHSLNWWVSPTYAHSEMAYDIVKDMLPEGRYEEKKSDLTLLLKTPGGKQWSEIVFKSGEKESSLRGYGVDFFIMDEAARIKEESWNSVLTTVTQTRGRGIIISTPKGRGWFYDAYMKGEKFDAKGRPLYGPMNPDKFPEWFSIRLATWHNPTVPIEAIRDAKRNTPEDVFRQEFAAQFLDDSAGVFRGVTECCQGSLLIPPMPGRKYVMGLDLARANDYSVIVVMDQAARHVVYIERFNQIDWEIQYDKIIQIAQRYNCTVCVDESGLGDPVVSRLFHAGLRLEPYKITGSAKKHALIDKLRLNIEEGNISYPYNRHTLPLLDELRSYEMEFTPSGVVKYQSPRNKHDDTVIALALANWILDMAQSGYKMRFASGI